MNDKKLFEICCKEELMRIVQESQSLNKKLTFFQKTLLYDKIKEMPLSEVLSILKEKDDESKTSKVAKYGLAGYLGRKVGKRAIGGAPIKALGYELVPGRTTKIGSTGNPRKKVTVQSRKFGKLGAVKGGIRGALAGVAALFLFRKLSDPCVRQNLMNKEGQKKCKAAAARKVIAQIQKDMKACNNAPNPTACRAKLSKNLEKMNDILQQNS